MVAASEMDGGSGYDGRMEAAVAAARGSECTYWDVVPSEI